MPHQCTNCARTFPDGSKEMLSGCPDCGGNKFQFTPQRAASDSTTDENRPRRSDSSRANGTARGADGSWPLDDWLSDDGAGRARDLPSEFPEWPDTARRPADRSDADSRRRAGADASDDVAAVARRQVAAGCLEQAGRRGIRHGDQVEVDRIHNRGTGKVESPVNA